MFKKVFPLFRVFSVWFLFLGLSLILAPEVDARVVGLVAGESAKLKVLQIKTPSKLDTRVIKLRKYMSGRGAPLTAFADVFVLMADKYEMDWRLVAAISGVESNFGKRVPYGSFNAWGWDNGEYRFRSWEDGIGHVNRVLKEKYVDRGLVTPNQIGPVYAPPSSTWSGNVNYFIREFDRVEIPVADQLSMRLD